MANSSPRRVPPAGDPFAAAPHPGDAACRWHRLDAALPDLCRARDRLEAAGCEALAGRIEEVIEAVEAEHDRAEQIVMAALETEGERGVRR